MDIYTVTTLSKLEETHLGFIDTGECRCVGWYQTFEDADSCVRNNRCDIYEAGSYPYAIIEKTSEGLYPETFIRFLYKFDDETDRYIPIDEPEQLHQICNFGIG